MVCKSSSENIVISLLNVRSLKKHCTDIKSDSKIIQSDIIVFTETLLKPLQNIDIIQEALNEFQIVHEDQTNNYLSSAICANLNHGVSVSDNEFFPQVNGIYAETVKCQTRVNVLLLYRAKDIYPPHFCNNLENIIFSHEIDLIVGDFNMKFFNETDSYRLI